RQRPDIRAAERVLASRTARIGVTTADLYPSFSLAGFLTFNWGNVGNDTTSIGWSLLPGFNWNLFDRARIHSAIDVAEAQSEQAFFAYELTVLRALEEVENAMIAYFKEQERRDRLEEAVDAAQRAVDLVRTQYLAGLTNFQNVLDSQRSLFRFQDQLAESEGLAVQNLILIYRSLGGGWDVDAATIPATTDNE
ncbi:MAG: TolC family protein, partial [Acidobacteria bacterium]